MTPHAIRKTKREIAEGPASTRPERVAEYRSLAESDVARCEKQQSESADAWRGECDLAGFEVSDDATPAIDETDASSVTIDRRAGGSALALEVVLGCALAVKLFWMPTLAAIAIGMLLSLFLAFVAKAAIAATDRRNDPHGSTRVVKAVAWATSTVSGVAAGTFLVARFLPAWAITSVPATLSVLEFALAATAGAWLQLANVRDRRNILARNWVGLQREIDVTKAFLAALPSVPADSPDQRPTRAQRATAMPLREATTAVVAALLLFSAPGYVIAATTFDRLIVALDGSGSGDGQEYRRVVDGFGGSLEPFLRRHPTIRQVAILRWSNAGDAWRGLSDAAVVPERACPTPQVHRHSEAGDFLSLTRQAEETAWQEEAVRRAAAADAAYTTALQEATDHVHRTLRAFDVDAKAPVTCVDDVMARLMSEKPGTMALVFTDGQNFRCGKMRGSDHDEPSPGVAVIVVLLPGRHDGNEVHSRMRSRTRELTRRFPAVRVVPAYQVDASLEFLDDTAQTDFAAGGGPPSTPMVLVSERDASVAVADAATVDSSSVEESFRGTPAVSARWGSGWIDLEEQLDLVRGDWLRLRVGGTATRVIVRFLHDLDAGDDPVGVDGGVRDVPANRVLDVILTADHPGVRQVSVHGSPRAWSWSLGTTNGPATLESAHRIRGAHPITRARR